MRIAAIALSLLLSGVATAQTNTLYWGPVDSDLASLQTVKRTSQRSSGRALGLLLHKLDAADRNRVLGVDWSASMLVGVTGPIGTRITRVHKDTTTKTLQVLVEEAPTSQPGVTLHVIRLTRRVLFSGWLGRTHGWSGWTVEFQREKLELKTLTGSLRLKASWLETVDGNYALRWMNMLNQPRPPNRREALRYEALYRNGNANGIMAEVEGLVSETRKQVLAVRRLKVRGLTMNRVEVYGRVVEGGLGTFTELVPLARSLDLASHEGKQVTYMGWFMQDEDGRVRPTFYVEDVLELEGHEGSPSRFGAYARVEGLPTPGTLHRLSAGPRATGARGAAGNLASDPR